MKLIYVVIDGMGDRPVKELDGKTPLEYAATPHMDSLAERGRTGLMYPVRRGIAPESDVAVISILGYDPFRYRASRGVMEALGSGLEVRDGDLALRCNFATLGAGDRIVDRRVARTLTTGEAAELGRAVNEGVRLESYPADFEFRSTIGHRGALVIRGWRGPLSGEITNTDPAYSRVEGLGVAKAKFKMALRECKPLSETEGARASASLVNEFTQKSHGVLEGHPVNRRRLGEGKLKANVILTRDAGHSLPRFFDIGERYGVRFACLADMSVERGISKLAGMSLVDLPPPSQDLGEDCALRAERLLGLLSSYDCFYLHIKGTDEPGHDGKPLLKAQLIQAVDERLFGGLLSSLDLRDHLICVTADHATPCELKTHSDDPVPLLIAGGGVPADATERFTEKECRAGSLGLLERGTELMPMLMRFLRGSQ